MSIKQYKFVSPGVQVKEIDNSGLPEAPIGIGPLVIGRTQRGPGMRPVRVNSMSEFINIFGNPQPGGVSATTDVWRDNPDLAPTYASYAAMAWLANNSPLNVIRLLGHQNADAEADAGKAGWMTEVDGSETINGTADTTGGAYGLFICNSSSAVHGNAATSPVLGNQVTGTLAAVFYVNEGFVALSGTVRGYDKVNRKTVTTASNATLIESNGTYHTFTAAIGNAQGNIIDTITFNFDRGSANYIRKVFNTNPTNTNSAITVAANTASYWLGESYERFLIDGDGQVGTGSTSLAPFSGLGAGGANGGSLGVMLGLGDATNQWSNHRYAQQPAQTGWFIGQDLGAAAQFQAHKMDKLFKIHALESGQWDMHNLKVSITDLKRSTNDTDKYGTFTVLLRKISDTDGKMQIIERFSNCNLNPTSPKFVARVIGDKYVKFSATEKRNKEYGQFDNQSRFIRVEMHGASEGLDPVLLPWGVFGPAKAKGFSIVGMPSGNVGIGMTSGWNKYAPMNFGSDHNSVANMFGDAFVTGSTGVTVTDGAQAATAGGGWFVRTGVSGSVYDGAFTGSFHFPRVAMRLSSSDGNIPSADDAFYGFNTDRSRTSELFEKSNLDLVRPLPEGLSAVTFNDNFTSYPGFESSWVFSLDNVVSASDGTNSYYSSGSRADSTNANASITANGYNSKVGYEALLEYGIDSFTAPMFGGFDGLDITEKDPFANRVMDGKSEYNNYAFNSIKEAIDIVRDPEELDFNIATIPGVSVHNLTQYLIDTVEDRADALAVIDLKGDFKPSAESTDSYQTRVDDATVTGVVNNLRDRGINSSYACAYFPWVQAYDTINDNFVYVPPSVVALGVMSNSERTSELWFAPAGFNRGGLSQGAAGIPVVGITQKLTSKQRDKLYDANINPIAAFPQEGIVVFGQKTLQVTPSALDRINVRRLMIFLKKRISQIAADILFDPNVRVTWNRFTGQAEPFLRSVKAGLGLTDYKLVLDESTTTPELIDRNIMYAKIFLKPARAIEYIAIDFNISNTGAAFED